MTKIVTLGLDLSKRHVHVVGLDERGRLVDRRRLTRSRFLLEAVTMDRCLIGMEASCGAHHLARKLVDLGHEARLIAPEFVRPFVKAKTNKTDHRDAEAVAIAVQQGQMRFVPLKSEEQLDLQTLHRVRNGLVKRRTASINQMRSILAERDVVLPQGPSQLRRRLPEILADERLSGMIRRLLEDCSQGLRQLDERIARLDEQILAISRRNEVCRDLIELPGIGPLISTAAIAMVADPQSFGCGRHFSSWLGIVPREYTTGGTQRLGPITKRGNRYLRTLLIHGARAALPSLLKQPHTPLGQWLTELLKRKHRNVVIVALANKLARMIWAVLTKRTRYQAEMVTA